MSGPKAITIMGATGSIGTSAASVIAHANAAAEDPVFSVEALVAGRDVKGLARQALDLNARVAVIADPSGYDELKALLAGTDIEVAAGDAAVSEVATRPVHRVLAAIVGIDGLASTFAAVRAGNSVALANKESMVCAGPLLKAEAARAGVDLVPTDSEHNAMFQVMDRREDVERLILTASGGPFRESRKADLANVQLEDALAHPKWEMGQKISIDSATLFNKGLELIEAAYLFDMPQDRIDVIVHPQSIVHSLVTYRDGSVLAQLGTPDMQTPISYALSWPDRRQPTSVAPLDLIALGQLDFEPLDSVKFPSVGLARRVLELGGGAPTVLNSANECAVAAFLSGQCGFNDISRVVEQTIDRFVSNGVARERCESVEAVMTINLEARRFTTELLGSNMYASEQS
ncbi:MAG: 1-deoxy-D-xylulose-5-phosphate reductoisomerase [Pseudomonadota bacterium]